MAPLRPTPLDVLQIDDHAEGHPCVVRPLKGSSIDQGTPIVMLVVHAESALSGHGQTSLMGLGDYLYPGQVSDELILDRPYSLNCRAWATA